MDEDINNKIYLICKTVIMFYIYMRERERDVPSVLDLTFPPLKLDALEITLCTRTISCFWILSDITQIEICSNE